MIILVDPWGGLSVLWCDGRLALLFDGRGACAAWNGRQLRRVPVGLA